MVGYQNGVHGANVQKPVKQEQEHEQRRVQILHRNMEGKIVLIKVTHNNRRIVILLIVQVKYILTHI